MGKLFTLILIIALANSVFAQSPQKMSYQAVIRNSSGQLVASHAVGMRISILLGSVGGATVYTETQTPTTNANGLVSIEIGGIAGFDAINWAAGAYFIKTETDPTGGTNYTITGISQILSVPYALYAKTAKTADYNDLTDKPWLFDGTWTNLSGKPLFATVATSGNYNDLTNKPIIFDGTWTNLTGKPTTLTGYGITNGMSTSHAANGINSTMITNWNTAYGWGNHSGLYKLNSYVPTWVEITSKPTFAAVATSGLFADLLSKPTTLSGYGITDAMNTSHVANAITSTNISNWNNAYSWGNHSASGYAIYPSQPSNSGKFLTTNGTTVSWGALATIAATGSYNDLANKPIIPNQPAGNNSGDMMYWNGTTWVIVPVGSPGQYLHLSSSNIPTWTGATYCAVSTTTISSITSGSATIGGNVTDNGGAAVTTKGICYGTISAPTTANSFVTSGTGEGEFIANINGLAANTTYYVRAFAVNSAGTAYGDILNFTTLASGGYTTITDIMGNIYNTVTIGTQVWMKENLKTTRYNDGTPIPQVTDFITWRDLTTPAFCWYNNDSIAYHNLYGPLYNGYVISTNKLCPIGWHVPTDIEWSTLEKYLGMNQIEADSIYGWRSSGQVGTKLASEVGWSGSNISGFSALPGGYRNYDWGNYGKFDYLGSNAYIWGSTERYPTTLWYRQIASDTGRADHNKKEGMSVRCLKD